MKMSLSFSIDRILAPSEVRNKQLPKISLYAEKSNVPTSFGTEALGSRLGQNISKNDTKLNQVDAPYEMSDTPTAHDSENTKNNTYIDGKKQSLKLKTKKKTRTVFSRQQVFCLEAAFDAKRYLSSAERSEIATSLNLSETQVKVWFQNRRNKWKSRINSDGNASPTNEFGPIFLPPLMYSSIAINSHIQRNQTGVLQSAPFFGQQIFH